MISTLCRQALCLRDIEVFFGDNWGILEGYLVVEGNVYGVAARRWVMDS